MIPAIENLPRIRLGFYPTPLTEMVQLSAALGGPRIFIKWTAPLWLGRKG